ncbi:MAG TPA: transglycosylase domain-containing protein [Streptosporangiaceae bacterium]|nr:transglycosylase domain-containing protein [Streptosporangiaceae bacterium]
MSNPDLPGPYWRDHDDAGQDAWGAGSSRHRREESAWDDGNADFWRGDRNGGRSGSRGGSRDAGSRDAGSRDAGSRDAGSRDAGRRRADRASSARDDWDAGRGANGARHNRGKFGQAADDLKGKLGISGALGAVNELRARGAGGTRGSRRRGAGTAASYRGATSGYGHADYSDYGDDGRTSSRTAVRDHQDDFRGDGNGTGRLTRSRIAERTGVGRGAARRGGNGGNGGGGRRGGQGFKDWLLYGSWWRHWTWKKLFFVLGGGFAAFVLLAVIGIAIAYAMTPIPTDVSQTATWQSSSVYFGNGQLLGTFTNNQDIKRQLLPTSQMPQNVENAIIAAEDRNFYNEGGISVTGIMRASYQNLFGSGGIQGGSTITEQYAKNYYANIGASRNVTTKLKEIFVAIKLAHSRSKPWILTNYLNTVPFGSNVYGVWAAAENYFGVNLAKQGATLNTAQAAMLGAMPNNPAVFNPDPTSGIGYTMLIHRWQYVLGNMVRDSAISQAEANSLCVSCALPEAEKAFNANIHLNETGASNGWTGTNGYLMSMVEQELQSTYHMSLAKIQTGGLRITTTFSPSMMKAVTKAVNAEKAQLAATGGSPLPYYDHFGISLEDPKTGAIIAIYGGPGYGVSHCLRLLCDYNMAEAPHPVGSSMKPYVLAAAINMGMNVQTSVLNGFSPLWIPPEYNATYRAMLSTQQPPSIGPKAAKSAGWWVSQGEASLGPLSVTKAAAQSSDPAFTDLAHHIGVTSIIQMAQKFGVGDNPFNLGSNDLKSLNGLFGPHGTISGSVQIALGQGDLTPIEQASTFATLINGGTYHAPHVILKLFESTPNGQQQLPVKVAAHPVLSPQAAADEDYALSYDTINGTGYPNATWPGRPTIAKTGTLGNGNLASEAWFIGAIPQYSMAVGLWTNTQNQNLDNLPSLGGIGGSFGGAWPAATWKAFMQAKAANLPVLALPTPDYNGFAKWVLVAPHKQKAKGCRQQGQNQGQPCFCNKHGNGCQPNPNPTPTPCQFTVQGCGGGGGGGPTPTPTVTPTVTPTPCLTPPCGHAVVNTTAITRTGVSTQTAVFAVALSPAEETLIRRSAGTRLLL